MKFKTIAVIAACVAISAFFFVRSCRSDAAYRQAKLEYAGYKAIAEADNAMSHGLIDSLTTKISQMTNEIGQKDKTIADQTAALASNRVDIKNKDAEVAALRQEVQPVLDQNPKVKELVASLDTAILLRDKLIIDQDNLIAALKDRVSLADQRYEAQVKVSAEWQAMYDREAALRKQCEGLVKAGELRIGRSKFITKAAVVVAGGLIAYSLVK